MAPAIYGRTPAVKGRSEAIVSHTRQTRQAVQLMVYNRSEMTLQWERASHLSVARCVLGTFLGVFASFVVLSEGGIARLGLRGFSTTGGGGGGGGGGVHAGLLGWMPAALLR
jgi:hypothetical protein